MKTPIRNFGKIFDPIKLAQFTKYIGNLNVISNNTSIVPRDVSGNIQLNEESETNPLLIIEPTATKIQLASVLKVLDTRFQYFKFPVTTQVTPEPLPSFDLSLPEQEQDINTELRLPLLYDDRNQPITIEKINTSYSSEWFYSTGFESSGFKELPFKGGTQLRDNAYTLTKSTIDILRARGKTLRFIIQTQFTSTVTTSNTAFKIQLNRSNIKSWRPYLFPVIELATIGTPVNAYPLLGMEFILNASDLIEDDVFTISAVSGNPAYVLTANSYWTIEVVDIPNKTPLYGINNTSGVYDIQGSSDIVTLNAIAYENPAIIVGTKNPGSAEFIFKQ
jgi:hypothetical protein